MQVTLLAVFILSFLPHKIPTSSTQNTKRRHEPVTDRIRTVGAIAVLAFVILVHESGHYLTARALGIRVEEFGIGFGPKLLGWTAFGNDFSLRALLLGGYVRFPKHHVTTKAPLAELAKWLEDADNETTFQPEHNNDNLSVGESRNVCKRFSTPVRCGRS